MDEKSTPQRYMYLFNKGSAILFELTITILAELVWCRLILLFTFAIRTNCLSRRSRPVIDLNKITDFRPSDYVLSSLNDSATSANSQSNTSASSLSNAFMDSSWLVMEIKQVGLYDQTIR